MEKNAVPVRPASDQKPGTISPAVWREPHRREATTTEKRKTAKDRYDERTAKYYSLKLNKNTDSDIVAKLENVDSVQGYIKQLIRDDISKK